MNWGKVAKWLAENEWPVVINNQWRGSGSSGWKEFADLSIVSGYESGLWIHPRVLAEALVERITSDFEDNGVHHHSFETVRNWLKDEHSGDCTKECHTCMRCLAEEITHGVDASDYTEVKRKLGMK